ncbi:MAG: class I SAM-dependent methyltransferase [Candidatus Aminicenantes bacterium]
MIVFGSELRYHPKLREEKLSPFLPLANLYYQMLGIFGFYGGGEYLRSLYFRKVLKRYKFAVDSVLDAGCGYGYYAFYLARKYPRASIQACDFDAEMIKENKQIRNLLKLDNLKFFEADLVEFYAGEKYDFIFSIDVLEAIEDDEKVVRNLSGSLKNGGYFLLHIPRRDTTGGEDWWEEECPYRVREGYTLKEISRLLERNGLEIQEVVHTFGPLGMAANKVDFLIRKRFLKKMFAVPLNCINFLDSLFPHREGHAFLVVARKRRAD